MRVMFGNYVVAINEAICYGKQLVFKTCNGDYYHTDDYYHENIAVAVLNDLLTNGYIRVDILHLKEDF